MSEIGVVLDAGLRLVEWVVAGLLPVSMRAGRALLRIGGSGEVEIGGRV